MINLIAYIAVLVDSAGSNHFLVGLVQQRMLLHGDRNIISKRSVKRLFFASLNSCTMKERLHPEGK